MRKLKTTLAVVATLALAAIAPVAAQANHVDAPATAASAKCVLVGSTPTVSVDVSFKDFAQGNTGITGTIKEGATTLATVAPFNQTGSFTKNVTFPSTAGPHTFVGSFTWAYKGSNNGAFSVNVTCPAPPTPPSCGTTITCPPNTIIEHTTTVEHTNTVVIEKPVEQSCVSQRTIKWLIRPNYPGSTNRAGRDVVGIDRTQKGPVFRGVSAGSGIYTGFDADGKVIVTSVHKVKSGKNKGRYQAVIHAEGHRFTGFNNSIRATVWLKLKGVKPSYRTSYFADLCRNIAGNPNDQRSRAPEIASGS